MVWWHIIAGEKSFFYHVLHDKTTNQYADPQTQPCLHVDVASSVSQSRALSNRGETGERGKENKQKSRKP
jgi:CelD/BcsL family acetyltransferase involved in cellulose biosynthesis